jgi:hypothetical protein
MSEFNMDKRNDDPTWYREIERNRFRAAWSARHAQKTPDRHDEDASREAELAIALAPNAYRLFFFEASDEICGLKLLADDDVSAIRAAQNQGRARGQCRGFELWLASRLVFAEHYLRV